MVSCRSRLTPSTKMVCCVRSSRWILTEHEQVVVSVVKVTSGRSSLAVEYIERIKREQRDAEPAPGHEELRRRLAKIPGSMAAEIVADRAGNADPWTKTTAKPPASIATLGKAIRTRPTGEPHRILASPPPAWSVPKTTTLKACAACSPPTSKS
jgi:hypothetical protein